MNRSLSVDTSAVATSCGSILPVQVSGGMSPFPLQSRPRSASCGGADGVPSIVLSGPRAPRSESQQVEKRFGVLCSSAREFFLDDADQEENDATRGASRHYSDGRDLERLRVLRSHGATINANAHQTPRMKDAFLTGQTSPAGMSYCPRSPSVAAGRCEEAMEAQMGPGTFSPACVCSISSIGATVGDGKMAGKHMTLSRNMDDAHAAEESDGPRVTEDLIKRDEERRMSPIRPAFEGVSLFSNRTNQIPMRCGSRTLPHTPVGINTSHPNEERQKGKQCPTDYRKDGPCTPTRGNNRLPLPDQPPISVILTTGKGPGGHRRRVTPDENVRVAGGGHWILSDDPGCRGEASEEPVLLSAVLDRNWGAVCEKELASWKQRCILAEQQLAVATQCINEYCASTVATTRSSSPPQKSASLPQKKKEETLGSSSLPSEIDLQKRRLGKLPQSAAAAAVAVVVAATSCNQTANTYEDAKERGREKKGEGGMYNTGAVRHRMNCMDASTSTVEEMAKWVPEEEFQRVKDTGNRLRVECDTLKNELCKQVVRYEALETILLSKEEEQVYQKEEWLLQEKKMKGRQEELEASLCETRLSAANTMKQVAQMEKDLEMAQSQCREMETQVAAANAEVRILRAAGAERLEESRSLQMQLQQLETDLQLSSSNASKNKGCAGAEDEKINENDMTKLSGLACRNAEKQLHRVLASLREGDASGDWIVSQLVHIMRTVGSAVSHEKEISTRMSDANADHDNVSDSGDGGSDTERKMMLQLAESLEALIEAREGALRDDWETPTFLFDEGWDKSPTSTQHDSGPTELVGRLQKCVSRLLLLTDALQQRHLELREELKVVRADRNELVGQQSQSVRSLQQQLLTVEQEKARLVSAVVERDARIRRMEETGSLDATSAVSAKQFSLVTMEQVSSLQAAHIGELERLEEHMKEEAEEFGRSLLASLVEVLQEVAQMQGERLAVAEGRSIAFQSQLQLLGEERVAKQQMQEAVLGALRAQLTTTRAELASKEDALRIALQAQLRQGVGRLQRSFMDRASQTAENLSSFSTPCDLIVTPSPPPSPPSGVAEKEGRGISRGTNDKTAFMGTPEVEEERIVSASVVCEVTQPSLQYHHKKNDAARRVVTFASSVLIAEGEKDMKQQQQQQQQQQEEEQTLPAWCSPVSPSTSSTFSSTPSLKAAAAAAEHFSSAHAVQRGVMRRHREVWMRQAELMGIPIDRE